MKRQLAWLFVCGAFKLQAAVVFYDSFGYLPPGEQLSTAGSSFWSLRNATPQVDPRIAPGSLTYPGLQTVSGDNSIGFNGTGPSGIASRIFGDVYNIDNAPTIYYSLTLQVTSIGAADWGGSSNWSTGAFMMGFSQDAGIPLNNPNVAAPLLIRTGDPTNGSGNADSFQGFQLGTGVTAAQTTTNRIFDNSRVYLPNTTLFLVLAYTFGPNSADDVARLWVNPIPGTLESVNVPVVTTMGPADVVNGQIQAFFLRNNPVQPTGTTIDDLRLGTTWEEVTPVPEPSSFGMILCAAALLGRRSR